MKQLNSRNAGAWMKIMVLFIISIWLSTPMAGQVTFVQTSSGDFSQGSLENIVIPGDYVSLPAQGTGFNPWLTATVLPQALSGHRMITWKNTYVYCIGGNTGVANVNSVYLASIQSNGNGGWTAQNALPVALKDAAVAIGINTIYVFGGSINGIPSSQIYYASLATNGTIGTWQTSSVQLPTPLWGHSAHFIDGYIYIVGGSSVAEPATASSSVFMVTLDANSQITEIEATTPLPQARNGFSSAVYGSQLIVMGGFDNSGTKSNTVYYTTFGTNGTANAWQTASNLPVSVSNQSSTCFNGLLTIISGEKDVAGTPTLSNNMYYCDLSTFPTLTWTLMTDPLYDYTKNGQAFAANGVISYQGGVDLSTYPSYNSRYSAVTTNSQFVTKGSFVSYPFYQLGDNRNILSLAYTFSPASACNIFYRVAANDGVWSDWIAGTATPTLINQNKRFVQYLFQFNGTGIATAQLNDVTLAIQGTQLSGNLNAMATLTASNSPYWATSNISFTAGSHTIEPGVTILFSPYTGLEIGQANMLFNGNEENPIILTYYTSAIGQWNGVYFNENSDAGVSSDMNYTIIEKAGYGSNNANLRCYATQEPYLNHCIIREADGIGIHLTSAAITAENCLISNNTEAGFYLSNSSPILISTTIEGNLGSGICYNDVASSPNFSGCTIQNNLYAYYHPSPNISISGANGTVTVINNTYNGHAVSGGTIDGNRLWNDPVMNFFVIGNIKIGLNNSIARLTIEPGNTIKFAAGFGIQVGYWQQYSNPFAGEIYAVGSLANPIIFTSINGQPGGWNGIYFHDYSDNFGAVSNFHYCTIEKGNSYNVYCENASSAKFYHSKIKNGLTDGCSFYSSAPLFENCQFENNGRYPMYCTNYCQPILTGCTFTGNVNNYYTYVGGTIWSNFILKNYGIDYFFETGATIGLHQSYVTLSVDKGNTIRFAQGTGLQLGYSQSGYNPFGGGLYAVGTADSLITFTSLNGQAGGWNGIYFHDHSDAYGAVSTMKYCTVEKGNSYNIYCENTNQPGISFSTIQNSVGIGINCYNSMSALSNLQIINNAGYGLYYNNAYYIPQLFDLDISGNSLDGVVSGGGTISVSRTWKNFGGIYNFLGSVTIGIHQSNVTLTINPGITLKFAVGTGLQLGYYQSGYNPFGGGLYAVGTTDSLITFTSLNGQTGGWNGIYFQDYSDAYGAASTMKYCTVEKGNTYNIYCENTNQPGISFSTIQNAAGIGINCYNSMSPINNLQIINNAGYGLYYNHPYYIPQLSNLNITGNSLDGVVSEGGTINASRTWTYFGGNYNILGGVIIGIHQSYGVLTIKPGNTIRFAQGFGLQLGYYQGGMNPFGGGISAIGTIDSMITFTAVNGLPGGWNGIYFHDYSDAYGANSAMKYCIIENGLNYNVYLENSSTTTLENNYLRNSIIGLNLYNSSLNLKSTRIANNSETGIYVNGSSTLTLGNTDSTGNDLFSNALFNVYNNTTNLINAKYNFWGQIDSIGIINSNYDFLDNSAKGKISISQNFDFPQTNYSTLALTGNLNYANTSSSSMGNDVVSLVSVEDSLSTTTNSTGAFSIANVPLGAYKYSFDTDLEAWGGVNSTDALLILKHFAHIDTLEGNLFQVGDVNLSHTLNGTDAMLVMKRYAGLITSFPAGDYFYYLNSYSITNTSVTNDLRFHWMGDVNGSYVGSGAKSSPVLFHEGQIVLNPGTEVLVPVSLTQAANLSAISISMDYPSEYLEFEEAIFTATGQTLYASASNGIIKLAWANTNPISLNSNDVLVYLKFNVVSVPNASPLNLSLNNDSELADPFGNVVDITMNTPELIGSIITGNTDSDLPGFTLGSVIPNPISTNGELVYSLPVNGIVGLTLYNSLGQLIMPLDNGPKTIGNYHVQINVSNLQPGIYFCRLNISTDKGDYSRVNKMIISK